MVHAVKSISDSRILRSWSRDRLGFDKECHGSFYDDGMGYCICC